MGYCFAIVVGLVLEAVSLAAAKVMIVSVSLPHSALANVGLMIRRKADMRECRMQ